MRTIKQEFQSANILELTLKHNGYQGGDAGHGGFVDITLENSTSFYINGKEDNYVNIHFKGDCERKTLIEALKVIITELETNK